MPARYNYERFHRRKGFRLQPRHHPRRETIGMSRGTLAAVIAGAVSVLALFILLGWACWPKSKEERKVDAVSASAKKSSSDHDIRITPKSKSSQSCCEWMRSNPWLTAVLALTGVATVCFLGKFVLDNLGTELPGVTISGTTSLKGDPESELSQSSTVPKKVNHPRWRPAVSHSQ